MNVRLVLRPPAAAMDVKHDRRKFLRLREPHIHRLAKVRSIRHIDEGRGRGIGFVGGVELAHLGGRHPAIRALFIGFVGAGDEVEAVRSEFLRWHVHLHLRETIGEPALVAIGRHRPQSATVEPHIELRRRSIRQTHPKADTFCDLRIGRCGRQLLVRHLHRHFELGTCLDELLHRFWKCLRGDLFLRCSRRGHHEAFAANRLWIEKTERELALLVPQLHTARTTLRRIPTIRGDKMPDEVPQTIHRITGHVFIQPRLIADLHEAFHPRHKTLLPRHLLRDDHRVILRVAVVR